MRLVPVQASRLEEREVRGMIGGEAAFRATSGLPRTRAAQRDRDRSRLSPGVRSV